MTPAFSSGKPKSYIVPSPSRRAIAASRSMPVRRAI
jgi:hypothetical protein